MCDIEMPKYKCHKEVWALKIKGLYRDENGLYFVPVEAAYGPIAIDDALYEKYKPEVDWYYVIYEDGYKAFSPQKAFELGYTAI